MIDYLYRFDDGFEFELTVDEHAFLPSDETDAPQTWAHLETNRCGHCRLPDDRPSCPAATAISPLVDAFADRMSFDSVHTKVWVRGKIVEATTDTQTAIRSLAGLLLALSGCPVMAMLRPLAHFHVPFASRDHMVFRVFGMYLLAQHLRGRDGLEPDWDLDNLMHLYEEIGEVNAGLAARLRSAQMKDAVVNSIVMLNTYAQAVELSFERNLSRIRSLFEVYLKSP